MTRRNLQESLNPSSPAVCNLSKPCLVDIIGLKISVDKVKVVNERLIVCSNQMIPALDLSVHGNVVLSRVRFILVKEPLHNINVVCPNRKRAIQLFFVTPRTPRARLSEFRQLNHHLSSFRCHRTRMCRIHFEHSAL